jgi:hypothetical protein
MSNKLPITPPPELFAEWLREARLNHDDKSRTVVAMVADRAAQWVADQELEACREWLNRCGFYQTSNHLRATRRPKPPSLAEQGMKALSKGCFPSDDEIATIRTALTRLAELEANQ